MNCDQYLELMSAALDGECTAEERRELDSHLAVCPECAQLFRILSANANAARELDCEMPADLKSRIMSNLPEQERAVKQGKVIHFKRWIPVAAAACLVLVISLFPGSMKDLSMSNGAQEAAPAASTAVGKADARDGSVDDYHYSYGVQDTAEEPQANAEDYAGSTPAEEPMPDPESPENLGSAIHVYGNPQAIRVSYGATPKAGAVIIDSVEALNTYLAQFSSQCWDGEGNELPIAELDALKDVYTKDWFRSFNLLCIVVESGSGSNRYEIYPYSDDRNTVTVIEEIPEVGTCDMAAWLLVAEVDDTFSADNTPDVKFVR